MAIRGSSLALLAALALVANVSRAKEGDDADAKGLAESRELDFHYGATITKLTPGAKARVWIPVPRTNSEQDAKIVNVRVPGEYRHTKGMKFGNEFLYFEAAADDRGEIALEATYRIKRRLVKSIGALADDADEPAYLESSSLVPVTGEIFPRFFDAGPPKGDAREIARQLYDRVDDYMKYDKTGEGWGRGDVLWVCDSKRGNCCDFHSLFISMSRELKIPAKFEMGFPVPADKPEREIAGYHCWARFLADGRWVGVDISEADKHPEKKGLFFGTLPADRVLFSTERDLVLEPPQAGEPVNYLIYPYVEVNGKPHTSQTRKFSFVAR